MSANNKKKEEPKYILKKDFENRCPYCGSNKIERFGAFGTGGGSTSKLPNMETEVWSCKECKRLTHSSPPTAPPIFSHTLLNFPIYKDIPDNHDSSPFSLFSRHFGQELVKIFWLIIGLSFLCLALRANIDIPVNADLIQILKKEYSDWLGRNIEIMVMVANDGKIFRFSGTAECISLSPWEIKRTLAYNGHIVADIILCVHNHNKNEDFSPEDRKFYRWLKVNGFKGRFMIYYPLRQAFKELKD